MSVVVKFFGNVDGNTVNQLINNIDIKLSQGHKDFIILISSPGGSVFHGVSAYNYLKGVPANITTHNFGSVDSIGVILYCGGSKRLSVPQARFLLHGVSTSFPPNTRLEEPQLEEVLKGIKLDIENIAKIIAENTGKTTEQVKHALLERTTLNPEEAKDWGLVQEIQSKLFEEGSEVISVIGQT